MIKTEDKSKDEKSRAKYKCPSELEKIINLLRLKIKDRRGDFSINVSIEKDKEFLDYLETLHPQVRDYLLDFEIPDVIPIRKDDNKATQEAEEHQRWLICMTSFARYSDLMLAQSLLSQIAERNKAVSELKKRYGFESVGIKVIDENTNQIAGLIADSRGFLRPIKSSFLSIFEGINEQGIDEIDYKRIRQCQICGNIFWQKRNDSETCSLECANTWRVRLSRLLTPEQKADRQAKRSANRIYKQKAINKKEKK